MKIFFNFSERYIEMLSETGLEGEDITSLVLSSGGPRAFPAVTTCLEMLVLQKKLRLSNIRNVRGTSAGAAVALAIAIGMTISELRQECSVALAHASDVNFHFSNLFACFGVASLENIHKCLVEMLHSKGLNPGTTFAELKQHTGRALCTIATNAMDGNSVVYSTLRTPNLSVIEAVLASMAIPFMLAPRKLSVGAQTILCVDGALCNPFPLIVPGEPDLNTKTTLGIRITTMKPTQTTTDVNTLEFIQYASNLASMMFSKFEQSDTYDYFVITIECKMRGTGFHLPKAFITAIETTAALATARASQNIKSFEYGNVDRATQTP